MQILTAAVGLIGTIGWFWLQRVTSHIDEMREELSQKGMQISQLESYVLTNEKRLDRIETKIDKLLDRSMHN